MALKSFFVAFLVFLSSPAWAARAKKVSVPSSESIGFDLQYWGTSFEKYLWTVDSSFSHQSRGVYVSLDWHVINDSAGKLGIGLNSGFGLAANVNLSENIQASLVTVPVGVFTSYRADLIPDQVLIPYVKIGYEWLLNTQTSQTGGAREGWRRFQSLIGGAGLALNLSSIDQKQGNYLDSITGINGVYLTIEYFLARGILGEQIVNLTHQEIRLGLRVEG